MFWLEFCFGHRIICIEWWFHAPNNSFRNAFAWPNDTISTDPRVMFDKRFRLLHICLNFFNFRPTIEAILSSHNRTLKHRYTKWMTKNIGCMVLQLKCCHYSMVTIGCLLFASFTIKCVGTASWLAIFVCLYQQKIIRYLQDPYPTRATLYLNKPKCTHTVNIRRTGFFS